VGACDASLLVAMGGSAEGCEVCCKPCFGGVYVGQHSELLWPHDLTDGIDHSRVSPCGERHGLGDVWVGSACYYPRARRGGQRPPANVL
jgi:hypothetical protein